MTFLSFQISRNLSAQPAPVTAFCLHAFHSGVKTLKMTIDSLGNIVDSALVIGTRTMDLGSEAENRIKETFENGEPFEVQFLDYTSIFIVSILEGMPLDSKARFWKVIKQIRLIDRDSFSPASYDYKNKSILIFRGIGQIDTFIFAYLLIHELGHGLHDATDSLMSPSLKFSFYFDKAIPFYPLASHFRIPYIEAKAFGMTWEFLRRIPQTMREELVHKYMDVLETLAEEEIDWDKFYESSENLQALFGMKVSSQIYLGTINPLILYLRALMLASHSKSEFIRLSVHGHGYSQSQIFHNGTMTLKQDPKKLVPTLYFIGKMFGIL